MKSGIGVFKLLYTGFEWDLSNAVKVQKHSVAISDIESLFEQEMLVMLDGKHSLVEERYIAVGAVSNLRKIFVAFTLRIYGKDIFIRVISARYMHKKEERAYESLKKSFQK